MRGNLHAAFLEELTVVIRLVYSTTPEDIALYFEEKKHLTTCEQYEDLDKGHGRFEIRRCYVTDQIHWLDRRQEWKGLKSIVAVESICVIKF